MERERLTQRLVWIFMSEGCNANEIAAYGGVTVSVALAMMARAARKHAGQVAREVLHRKAA